MTHTAFERKSYPLKLVDSGGYYNLHVNHRHTTELIIVTTFIEPTLNGVSTKCYDRYESIETAL